MSESKMDELTTAMMEHVCDNLCRYPRESRDPEQLEDICAECKMGKYVCGILNLVNGDLDKEKNNGNIERF